MTDFQVQGSKRARCGGSGLLYEPITPLLDQRDPRYEDREYECPGCPDCKESRVLERVECSGCGQEWHLMDCGGCGDEVVRRYVSEDEAERLRHGLGLIVRESEQFPDQDGIGAGTMARNLLKVAA